jgi:3',5'-cyclic AMP phosphodiesterase CpdA
MYGPVDPVPAPVVRIARRNVSTSGDDGAWVFDAGARLCRARRESVSTWAFSICRHQLTVCRIDVWGERQAEDYARVIKRVVPRLRNFRTKCVSALATRLGVLLKDGGEGFEMCPV